MHKKLEKKSRRKRNLNISTRTWIIIVSIVGVFILCLYVYCSQPGPIDRLSLTYLDNLRADTVQLPEESYDSVYEIEDYTVYGEYLVLYHTPYEPGVNDGLYGRTVSLKNIETGVEQTFVNSGGADSGIDLSQVQPGVYEIYVSDESYEPKRAYMKQEVNDDILTTTMRRSHAVNTAQLDADTDYLSRFQLVSDRNYLYLTVTDSLPKVKVMDVYLDPSGLVPLYDEEQSVDQGYTGTDMIESQASYALAQKVASLLEDAGLRVGISRNETDAIGYTGEDGRIGQAYASQAKLFVGLMMDDSELVSRPYLLASPFTNAGLANQIAWNLAADGVELAAVSSSSALNSGVAFDSLWLNSDYTATPWSSNALLRETGGKATSAGEVPAWVDNAQYGDEAGMNAVVFCYASSENADSRTYFLNHEDEIAQGIAQGILSYCRIPALEEGE